MKISSMLPLLAATITTLVAPAMAQTTDQIVFSSTRNGTSQIYISDTDGSAQQRLTDNLFNDRSPSLNANGDRVVFVSDRDGDNEIYIMNSDGSGQTQLTNNASDDTFPILNANASTIYFCSARQDTEATTDVEIYSMNANGTNVVQLTRNGSPDLRPALNPAQSRLVFETSRAGDSDIAIMNVDGSAPSLVLNTSLFERQPSFSPNGDSIVIARASGDIASKSELLSYNLNTRVGRRLTSNTTEESDPVYSADGTKIFFVSNGLIFSIPVNGGARTQISRSFFDDFEPSTSIKSSVDRSAFVAAFTPDEVTSFAGDPQTFTATIRDGNGVADIDTLYVVVGNTSEFLNNFVVAYDAKNNLLYVRNPQNSVFLGGFAPGSNRVISTPLASLNCERTIVERDLNDLTIRLSITPRQLAGRFPNSVTFPVFAAVTDLTPNTTPGATPTPTPVPTTTPTPVPGTPPAPPAVPDRRTVRFDEVSQWTLRPVSLNNRQASLSRQVSDVTFKNRLLLVVDHTAQTRTQQIRFVINDRNRAANGISVLLDLQANRFYLSDDAGLNFGNGRTIGDPAAGLSNSQVSILARDISIQQSSGGVIATIFLTPKASFVGTKNVYVTSTAENADAGPDNLNFWTILPATTTSPPRATSATSPAPSAPGS